MIDDRDEHPTRTGQRIRNPGDLEGQNERSHDQGMRVRGSGRDREDTSRYGRSDDDRSGLSGRDEDFDSRSSPRGDDRGYSWSQDRDMSRMDEGFRGRSYDDAQRSSRGGDRFGRDDRAMSGRDERDYTGSGTGQGYQSDRNLAGTSGRLGHDPERDYGRGGPIGGGRGYGGREWEGQGQGGSQFRDHEGERGRHGGHETSRDYGAGRELQGSRAGSTDDRGRGWAGQGSQPQGEYGQGQYGQGQYGQGQYGQGQYGQGQYGQYGQSGQGQYGQSGQYGQGQFGQGGHGQFGQGGPGQGQYGQYGPYGQGQFGQGPQGQRQLGQGGQGQFERGSSAGQRRGPMNYQRSDHRIYEDVCDALSDDQYLDCSNVEVKVEKGEVTVTGQVESRDMKRRLEDVIERVSGVKDVNIQVKVQRSSSMQGSPSTGAQSGSQSSIGSSTGTSAGTGSNDKNEKSSKPGPLGHAS